MQYFLYMTKPHNCTPPSFATIFPKGEVQEISFGPTATIANAPTDPKGPWHVRHLAYKTLKYDDIREKHM